MRRSLRREGRRRLALRRLVLLHDLRIWLGGHSHSITRVVIYGVSRRFGWCYRHWCSRRPGLHITQFSILHILQDIKLLENKIMSGAVFCKSHTSYCIAPRVASSSLT